MIVANWNKCCKQVGRVCDEYMQWLYVPTCVCFCVSLCMCIRFNIKYIPYYGTSSENLNNIAEGCPSALEGSQTGFWSVLECPGYTGALHQHVSDMGNTQWSLAVVGRQTWECESALLPGLAQIRGLLQGRDAKGQEPGASLSPSLALTH